MSKGACPGATPNAIINYLAGLESMYLRMNGQKMNALGSMTRIGEANIGVSHAVVNGIFSPLDGEWQKGGFSGATAIDGTHPFGWGNASMLPGVPLNYIWRFGKPGQNYFYILPAVIKYAN